MEPDAYWDARARRRQFILDEFRVGFYTTFEAFIIVMWVWREFFK